MKAEKIENAVVNKEIVCPKCYRPLFSYSLFNAGNDSYGRKFRNYLSWCNHCDVGFEAIQFQHNDKWLLHKYRFFVAVVPDGKPMPDNSWQLVNEIPVPAAVVTGPGGDYVKPFSPSEINIDAIKTMLNALKAAANSIECLLNFILDKK